MIFDKGEGDTDNNKFDIDHKDETYFLITKQTFNSLDKSTLSIRIKAVGNNGFFIQ